jgi:hypothetical protein
MCRSRTIPTPNSDNDNVKWLFSPCNAPNVHVKHEQRIRNKNHHNAAISKLVRSRFREPEVVGCRRHQNKMTSAKIQRLKWHARNANRERATFKDAQDGICVTACVIGDYDHDRMTRPSMNIVTRAWRRL